MALSDNCKRRLGIALASQNAAKEIIDEIAGLGAVAAGNYPAASGATTLGSADTDVTTIKGILQLSAPTGVVAAGSTQADATVLTSEINNVGTVGAGQGVKFPANTAGRVVSVYNGGANALKVYPATGGAINGGGANAAFVLPVGGYAKFECLATNVWRSGPGSSVDAVAPGYKIARGVHTQVAASDTVVTGLATVVAVAVSFQSLPTVKQLFCAGDVGDQAGSPAAGSILIKTLKPTAVNDVTPTAATDFSENLVLGWIAIGTG